MTLADHLRDIRALLLPVTLRNAIAQSPYYRRTLGHRIRGVVAEADLSRLPTIDRSTMVAYLDEIVCGAEADDVLTRSSGTSMGRPFIVRRSRAEIQELLRCQELVIQHGDRPSGDAPLILEIYDASHGLPTNLPPRNVIRVPPPETGRGGFAWVCELLSARHNFKDMQSRVSRIVSSATSLEYLTLYLLQENIDPSSFGVEELHLTGLNLTERWRALLAERWGAKVIDIYSLSEFASNGARDCGVCGYKHFVLPTLIPEVVDLTTGVPIDSGIGALVLTGLYPFVQRQPFIRYWTDDAVERGPTCPRDGVGFRPRGRLSDCLILTEGDERGALLLALDVHDVLDALPDIDRPPSASFFPKPRDVAAPWRRQVSRVSAQYELVHVEGGRPVIRLSVGLAFPPTLFPSRCTELSHVIRSQLCRRNPFLASKVADGLKLEIQFTPPYSPPPASPSTLGI